MHKPIIGITTLYDSIKEIMWMMPSYMKMIEDCGGIPVVLPISIDIESLSQLIDTCNGILFSGGQDVNPKLYNESPKDYLGELSDKRDTIESNIFNIAIAKNKPIFAICRGYQLVNVLLGGTLYQDLNIEFKGNIEHKITSGDQIIHNVEVVSYTKLSQITKSNTLCVNSLHHQGIKDLANSLVASSYSPDGLIESYELKDYKYLIGVQWHPEKLYDFIKEHKLLIESFINACK